MYETLIIDAREHSQEKPISENEKNAMLAESKGTIILNSVPNAEVAQKITAFLADRLKGTPRGKVEAIIRKAPVVLGRNVSSRTGSFLVNTLKRLGATAAYLPEPPDAEKSSHDRAVPAKPAEARPLKDIRSTELAALSPRKYQKKKDLKTQLMSTLSDVNKELWLILSMLVIIGLMNYLVTSQHMLLGLYSLPTVFSAYQYGRRHATLTAIASIFLVGIFIYYNPSKFYRAEDTILLQGRWYEIMAWGSILVITAYAMGTLYERSSARLRELRQTYHGLLMILRQFISKDEYTENHCYRVSIYAGKIAARLGCTPEQIDDIRSAGLLHDIGKLEVSRDLLYKAAKLSQNEFEDMKRHVEHGANMLEPVGGPLGRVIPIILAHHDKYDGSGYRPNESQDIPLESRILTVADVYDSLVSDRPYRKAMSPFEAKEIIAKGSGKDFDPGVVTAFLSAFQKGEMEIPHLIV